MSLEDFMTHSTWHGNYSPSTLKKAYPRSQLTSSRSITRRDLMRMKKMRRTNELAIMLFVICSNLFLTYLSIFIIFIYLTKQKERFPKILKSDIKEVGFSN